MSWSETTKVKSRKQFIKDWQKPHLSVTELCARYGVSRKTGYKWIHRFCELGFKGLEDASRAPKSCPHETPEGIRDLLIWARQERPFWGPKKLIPWLEKQYPGFPWPAPSTASRIIRDAGLVKGKKRRTRPKHADAVDPVTEAPNDIWTIDFKGQFKTKDGRYCYPLTVMDLHTRFILAIQAYPDTKGKGVFRTLKKLFRKHGLPKAIRSDNGSPFATNGRFRLSTFRVWLLQQGIQHQLIRPASPQENGAHERMHLTLKQEVCARPKANLQAQQRDFNSFRLQFNTDRPHEALHGETPASKYQPSPRQYSEVLTEPVYPGHFIVKKITSAGTFRHHQRLIFLSHALKGHNVGLEQEEPGIWRIHFAGFLLATMDEIEYRPRP